MPFPPTARLGAPAPTTATATAVSQTARTRPTSWRRLTSALVAALAASALTLGLLTACGPVLVGGVAVGAATIYDRRPYNVVIDDQNLELSAGIALREDPLLEGRSRIAVTSYNYSVLLTGQAETVEIAERATGIVSRLPKVRRVIDEISIGPTISLTRESEDVYLTTRAKLALSSVELDGFDATRVKVVSEDGVLYLMGLVSPQEAEAATEKVRYVPGVKRVVKLFEYITPDP